MTTHRVQRAQAATGERPRRQRVGPPAVLLAAIAVASALVPADLPTPFDRWNVGVAGQVLPTVSIGDASVVEGNSGVTILSFPVTLSAPSAQEVRVGYGTVGGVESGTATGGLTQVVRQSAGVLTTIPDVGPASNYPITINVSGMTGVLEQIDVALNGLTHTNPSDIDVLLEAPSGEKMVILSDAGGSTPAAKVVVTLKDDGSAPVPSPLASGIFWPYSGPPADSFPAPAPAGPYNEAGPAGPQTLNDVFRDIVANGPWKLWIADDTPGNQGSIGNIALTLGAADSNADFVPRFGQLVFPPGTTSKTIDVKVNGDLNVEATETILQDLFSPVGSLLGRARATGMIMNDDGGSGGTLPTVGDDSYTLSSTDSTTVPAASGVLANDNSNGGGPMTAELVGNASLGLVTLRPDGSFTYYPSDKYIFSDSFTYRATNSVGKSVVATVRLILRLGAPPTNFRVDDIDRSAGANRVTVRFDPPTQGPTPSQYVVKGGILPGQTLGSLLTDSSFPILEFDAPFGEFWLSAAGVIGNDVTGDSNVVPLNTTTSRVPSAPENLTIAVDGSTLHLAWNNTYTGGLLTTNILNVTGAANLSVPLGVTESFSFTGVPSGTYNFTIGAASAIGSSPTSNGVSGTFPGTCTGPPQMPENVLLFANGRNLGVIWDHPKNGPAPDGYKLDVESAVFTGRLTVQAQYKLVRGNVPAGTYGVRVVSTGCGQETAAPKQTVVIQ